MRQAPDAPDTPRGRLQELDVLRGLAAVYVVMNHYLWLYPHWIPRGEALKVTLPVSGQFAVHLFFVISGFVIFMTLDRCADAGGFLLRRCARIYPAYWAAVAFTSTVLVLVARPPLSPPTALEVLANLTLVHQFLGVRNVDGVYWTLAVEAAFYLWMAVLLLTRQLHRVRLWGWAWLGLCLAGSWLQRWPEGAAFLIGGTSLPLPLDHFLMLRHAPLFIAGICFYQLKNREAGWRAHTLIAASFLVYLWVCVRPGQTLGPRTVLAGAMVFGSFYLFVFGRLGWIVCRPLVFLGTISYGLYIGHDAWGRALRWFLQDRLGWSDTLALPLVSVSAFAVGVALTFGVERPAAQRFRRWTQARRPPAPAL